MGVKREDVKREKATVANSHVSRLHVISRLFERFDFSTAGRDLDETGLIGTKRERVAAEAVFDGVAERGAADDFDGGAIAETHLEESATDVGVATDGDDASAAADAEVVEATGVDRTGMVARRKVAGLLHIAKHSDHRYHGVEIPFHRSIRR
jgi:hypothetical protein